MRIIGKENWLNARKGCQVFGGDLLISHAEEVIPNVIVKLGDLANGTSELLL